MPVSESVSPHFFVTLDDDKNVNLILERHLGVRGISFESASELYKQRLPGEPLAVFVDIHLKHAEPGLDSIPRLRRLWPDAPVLVVTADPSSKSVQQAFAAGAHDFIRKPLDPTEVHARLNARLRDLHSKRRARELSFGDLVLDLQYRFLKCGNEERYISASDCALMKLLIAAGGQVVPRDGIKNEIWRKVAVSESAFNRKVYLLRNVLREIRSQVTIESLYGVGVFLKISKNEQL